MGNKYLGKHFQKEVQQEKPITDMTIDEVKKNYEQLKEKSKS